MGQRPKIVRFNEDLDEPGGPPREQEDEASRKRMAKYRAGGNLPLAEEAENDWRVSIGLEQI